LQLSENGLKVFNARYALKDESGQVIETFAEAVRRIAGAAAKAEQQDKKKWEKRFLETIGNLYFVPATPIWANMGKPDRPWQPGSCFVLEVADDLAAMYDTLKETALVFKSGGGVGYNLSGVRPRGTLVRSTKGLASGVLELIRLYDASANMVMQGGVRRGASIAILNVAHPEIVSFIEAKLDGSLTNFNLSVGITDEFMRALEAGEVWRMSFDAASGRVEREMPARELWEKIIAAAHTCGDPGLIFLDRLQEANPIRGKVLNAVNPCVTGDTWVLTTDGPRQVKELIGRPFEAVVDGKVYPSEIDGFFSTGTKAVVSLKTSEGYSLELTENHLVRRDNDWVPVSELVPGDTIVLNRHREVSKWDGLLSESEGYLLGMLVGDGCIAEEGAYLAVWGVGQGSVSIMDTVMGYVQSLPHRQDFKGWRKVKGRDEYTLRMMGLKKLASQMGIEKGHKVITPEVEKMSYDAYRGFLRGLFDADGTVIGSQNKGVSVRLSQSNIDLLSAVQRMLLRLGIYSKIYKNRRPAGFKVLPDSQRKPREYKIKAQHELVISRENIQLFADKVGFLNEFKAGRLRSLVASYRRPLYSAHFTARVESIEDCGTEDVYDVQIPGINAFDANGFYVHNCGELPLFPNESCLLGSINLACVVPEGGVDWDLLREVVRTAVRFLDDIIDVAEYPLEAIEKATKATRKIGLGYTGLHDLLIALNLPYGSAEGREMAGRVAAFIQKEAHTYSAELAEEKGSFPEWENSVYCPAQPRRNAACIAVAPTGSVTVMAGCESYGIEPIFAVAYTKKTNVAGEFEVFSPLFLAACAQHGVAKEVLSEVARRGTCQGVAGVPEELQCIFKGAQDIGYEDHILMQAQIQKYVDSGVSKTINLPNSATFEDVEKSYRMAYDLKIKGMTIFRDGCKEGTVTVGQGSKDEHAPRELRRGDILPRPVAAHGLTHRLDTGCGKIYLTVNYRPDTGQILETFITTGSDGGCQVYTEATSRLISLSIRGGIPVEEVVGQLQSTHSCPSYQMARGRGKKVSEGKSCASAIARKLKEIKDQLNGGAKEAADQAGVKCEMCGNPMDRAEGCYVCRECGYSRC